LKKVTAWPCTLAATATFNRVTLSAFGKAMAEEQRGKGTNVLLGPMINIARIPTGPPSCPSPLVHSSRFRVPGGRNFESRGEDPFLTSELATAEILGIQSVPGVMACAKHFVNNNQELNRTKTSADVDDRTQVLGASNRIKMLFSWR